MPRPSKYSVASERMPTRYQQRRGGGEAIWKFKKEDLTAHVNETYGACKNTQKMTRQGTRRSRVCKAFRTVLGNGYCMDCWDKEVDRLHNSAIQRKRKNQIPQDSISILPSDI